MTAGAQVRIVSARLDDPHAHTLDGYLATGGYRALRRAVTEMTPAQVHDEVRESGITGRSGGAAFPTANNFFAHESCGQCTPCREGTGWLEKVLHRIETGAGRLEDLDLLLDVGDNISPAPFPHPPRLGAAPAVVPFPFRQTTICPLGPSAVSPVESSIGRFRDDYLIHIKDGGCPYR